MFKNPNNKYMSAWKNNREIRIGPRIIQCLTFPKWFQIFLGCQPLDKHLTWPASPPRREGVTTCHRSGSKSCRHGNRRGRPPANRHMSPHSFPSRNTCVYSFSRPHKLSSLRSFDDNGYRFVCTDYRWVLSVRVWQWHSLQCQHRRHSVQQIVSSVLVQSERTLTRWESTKSDVPPRRNYSTVDWRCGTQCPLGGTRRQSAGALPGRKENS